MSEPTDQERLVQMGCDISEEVYDALPMRVKVAFWSLLEKLEGAQAGGFKEGALMTLAMCQREGVEDACLTRVAGRMSLDYRDVQQCRGLEACEVRPLQHVFGVDRQDHYVGVPDPDCGDVMTIEDFTENCACGGFIDYDGFGYPVRDGRYNNQIVIIPSRLDEIPASATHIIWFNR